MSKTNIVNCMKLILLLMSSPILEDNVGISSSFQLSLLLILTFLGLVIVGFLLVVFLFLLKKKKGPIRLAIYETNLKKN
ncbi:hypothetical protein RchiOBHm_Chr3g0496441 [Rosa chinensis]|uniref:Uncharacterized protein n=1 Tax=Rosa chinensis TaxID=74649 RepID=A0A2P6RHI2_ROSCH|nr:hypothetical protein RchiOBHm_Chr3g0496441 [Rosa chinensis]